MHMHRRLGLYMRTGSSLCRLCRPASEWELANGTKESTTHHRQLSSTK